LPFQLIESVDRKIALLKSAYQFAPKCDRGLSLDQITLVENGDIVWRLAKSVQCKNSMNPWRATCVRYGSNIFSSPLLYFLPLAPAPMWSSTSWD